MIHVWVSRDILLICCSRDIFISPDKSPGYIGMTDTAEISSKINDHVILHARKIKALNRHLTCI